MKCRITHQGARLKPSIVVHKADRVAFFSKNNELISIQINNTIGYTKLQPDFFTHVGQIRTVYPTKECEGQNLLIKWIEKSKGKVSFRDLPP